MNNNEHSHEPSESQQVDNAVFKCPGCGANLEFEPGASELACAYCDYRLKLKGQESDVEYDFFGETDEANTWSDETKILHCQNCGANNVVEKSVISYECPFCTSSLVSDMGELPGLRPQRVLPFSVNKNNTIILYTKWIKKRAFAPNNLKKDIPSPKINGVYLPMWTYDAETFSSYNGRLGKYYTETVGSGKNQRTVTKVRYFRISGTKHVSFDDILVTASRKVNQQQIEKLEPFNTNDSFIYDSRYLSGFSAEHYDITLKQGFEIAKYKAKKRIEQIILSSYHYDVVDYLNVTTTYDQVTYKYVLVPLWICSFIYNKKTYRYYVNGETGRLEGSAPVSPIKVTLFVLFIIIIIIVIAILIINYGNSSDYY